MFNLNNFAQTTLLFVLLAAVTACGSSGGAATTPLPTPTAIPTATDAAFAWTSGDDTGDGDTKGTVKATCASVPGWEYMVEATDTSGVVVGSGSCGATPLSINLESYVQHTISLYQRAVTGATALSGSGWTLVESKTLLAALSGCHIHSWDATNSITCVDRRNETNYRLCWSNSPFIWSNEDGVTCENFTVAAGETISYVHDNLSNHLDYYYIITVYDPDGSTTSLPPLTGALKGVPYAPMTLFAQKFV